MNEFTRELEIALQAAGQAGQRIADDYQTFVAIPDAPSSITTATDRASQDIILNYLSEHFPGDAFCAEEDTEVLRTLVRQGERTWIIDPIDGTRGFARKTGEFSVMVALCVAGEIVVGVVLEPAQSRVTFAARKAGCWVSIEGGDAVRCHTSTQRDPAEYTLAISHINPRDTALIEAMKPKRITETYSAGVKLALVARGEADCYVSDYTGFHDWDIAAGTILVQEAGGLNTRIDGKPLEYCRADHLQAAGILSCNRALHSSLVEKARPFWPKD